MNNNIEQVRTEIKRRIEQFKEERNKVPSKTSKSFDIISLGARIAALEEILVFVNSLISEKPSEDLEKEIERYFNDDKWFSTPLGDIARYFANWQKEQIIDKACEWLRYCIDTNDDVKMIDGEPEVNSLIQKNLHRIEVTNQIVAEFKKAMEDK